MKKPLILVTNDDGITAPGIRTLISIMQEFGTVVVVAPDSPQSATGHAITINNTLFINKITDDTAKIQEYSCSGTPVDCVKIAVNKLLDRKPDLIVSKTESYIKAINNLLDSQYKLSRYEEFIQTSLKFESIKNRVDLNLNENLLFLLFKYSSKHTLDKYFMLGEFDKGVQQISNIAEDLRVFGDEFNEHSKLIYYYKFACMYFGNDDYKNAVYWLNQIINARDEDLRSDILCFARILNLISHYELRNDDLVEYYIKSTYRFLGKKDDFETDKFTGCKKAIT